MQANVCKCKSISQHQLIGIPFEATVNISSYAFLFHFLLLWNKHWTHRSHQYVHLYDFFTELQEPQRSFIKHHLNFRDVQYFCNALLLTVFHLTSLQGWEKGNSRVEVGWVADKRVKLMFFFSFKRNIITLKGNVCRKVIKPCSLSHIAIISVCQLLNRPPTGQTAAGINNISAAQVPARHCKTLSTSSLFGWRCVGVCVLFTYFIIIPWLLLHTNTHNM